MKQGWVATYLATGVYDERLLPHSQTMPTYKHDFPWRVAIAWDGLTVKESASEFTRFDAFAQERWGRDCYCDYGELRFRHKRDALDCHDLFAGSGRHLPFKVFLKR